MKKLLVLFLLISHSFIAQENSISFTVVEKAPTFPGCKGDNTELKQCFTKSIQAHFAEYFDANLPNQLNLDAGKKKVFVGFTITETGEIDGVFVKAPHKKLELELKRVASLIPRMIPGKFKGKQISVKYTIPLTVVIKNPEKFSIEEVTSPPIFTNCENKKNDLKKCFDKSFQRHFFKNFNVNLPSYLNLKQGKYNFVMYGEIDKEGKISNIKVSAPHKKLIIEAERVLKLLPQIKPAKNKGKVVKSFFSVSFTLGI